MTRGTRGDYRHGDGQRKWIAWSAAIPTTLAALGALPAVAADELVHRDGATLRSDEGTSDSSFTVSGPLPGTLASVIPEPARVELAGDGAWLGSAAALPGSPLAELSWSISLVEPVFRVTDVRSGVSVSVAIAIANAPSRPVRGSGARVTYAQADADILVQARHDGLEDFHVFRSRPDVEEVGYTIDLAGAVAGLRLVADTLELLDAGGAPRLRMSAPYLIDAEGKRHDARVRVEGCAHDSDPGAPWGRAPTPPGASRCTARVSWEHRAIAYPAVLDPSWVATASMSSPRQFAAAAKLGNGKVLVAGGKSASATWTNTAELFDPGTSTWAMTGSMTVARGVTRTAVLLDGNVLVAGGYTTGLTLLASAEIYDVASGSWSTTTTMPFVNAEYGSVTLDTGKVMLAGGTTGASARDDVLVYDPAAKTWTVAPKLGTATARHTFARLPSGKVLSAGGCGKAASCTLKSAELFDPATGMWTPTGSMSTARERHASTVLADGRVLVTGGSTDPGNAIFASAELFDPANGSWTPAPSMANARRLHSATLLGNGKVLVAGGGTPVSAYVTNPIAGSELYDPTANTWTSLSPMGTARAGHIAAVLPSGSVLLAGGLSYSGMEVPIAGAELFVTDPGPAGDPCSGPADCASTVCAGGFCCSGACPSECRTCAGGTCALVAAGTTCGPTECTSDTLTVTACDAAGTCGLSSTTCAPYACATATACAATCAADADCDAGYQCLLGACEPKVADGGACQDAKSCNSGFCVDGVCCTSLCDGLCEACVQASTGKTDGACAPIPAGQDPDGECKEQAPASCGTTGACGGSGQCAVHPEGTPCGPEVCENGLLSSTICNGAEKCITTVLNCVPFACKGSSSCRTSCEADAECAVGHACNMAGACVPAEGTTSHCADDGTLVSALGESIDCAPYRCDNDACLENCTSVDDCATNHVCTGKRTCEPSGGSSDTTAGSACGCTVAGASGGHGAARVLSGLALGLVWTARRGYLARAGSRRGATRK